jgi:hypothetical protein
MTLQEAAQIYVDLIRLEESLAPDQHQARQEVSALRSKYHDLFTQALRERGLECADRFEATQRACELVASAAGDRGNSSIYTTVDGRRYKIIPFSDWQQSSHGGPLHCSYDVRRVSSKGLEERLIHFSIGCTILFGEEVYVNREDQIPNELAPLTIQWLLEDGGEPPIDYVYRVVFTQEGLRHRAGEPEDPQFGEDVCPTLRDVVEQVRRQLSEARTRGRQIGFRPPRSLWTHQSEIPQHA